MKSHHWPGNIRELRNVLSRPLAMGNSSLIKPGDLLLAEQSEPSNKDKTIFEEMSLEKTEKTQYSIKPIKSSPDPLNPQSFLPETLFSYKVVKRSP